MMTFGGKVTRKLKTDDEGKTDQHIFRTELRALASRL